MLKKISNISESKNIKERKPRISWLGIFQIFPILLIILHFLSQSVLLLPYYEKARQQLELEAKAILPPPSVQEAKYESKYTGAVAFVKIGYIAKDLDFSEIRDYYNDVLPKNGWLYYDESDTTAKYCKQDFTVTLFYNGHGIYPTDYDIDFESGHGRLVNVSKCERLYGFGPKSLSNLISASLFFIWSWLYGGILILSSFFDFGIYLYQYVQDKLIYKHNDFYQARVSGIKWIIIGNVWLAVIVYFMFFFEVYA